MTFHWNRCDVRWMCFFLAGFLIDKWRLDHSCGIFSKLKNESLMIGFTVIAPSIEQPSKTPMTFHSADWFIGFLIMVYYNPCKTIGSIIPYIQLITRVNWSLLFVSNKSFPTRSIQESPQGGPVPVTNRVITPQNGRINGLLGLLHPYKWSQNSTCNVVFVRLENIPYPFIQSSKTLMCVVKMVG